MREPLISVIVPVYNTEQYLRRCITSIQNNDYQTLEIICVNDGSTDNSLDELKNLANTDNRIRIIDKSNGGVASARNAGLDVAKGEYISFVDSDDYIHKHFFSTLMKVALDSKVEVVTAKFLQIESEWEKQADIVPENLQVQIVRAKDAMIRNGYLRANVCGRLFLRSLIQTRRFPLGIHLGEDTAFNVELVGMNDFRMAVVEYPLYFYFQGRSNSLVHSKDIEAGYILAQWYYNNQFSYVYKDAAIFAAFSALLSYRYEGSFSTKAGEIKKKAKVLLRKCLNVLDKEINCSVSKRIMYHIWTEIPMLYRMSVIIADRSYLHYERVLRERYSQTASKGA